jgi:hypothetical protein
VTPEEFDALFDTFHHTVARLEALPAYDVGGQEAVRIQAFREGRPRPLRSVATDPWLARIAVSTITAGKRWTRVRVVDEPLTEYQRYQLTSHQESQAAGERVLIAPRSAVGDVGPDFWTHMPLRWATTRRATGSAPPSSPTRTRSASSASDCRPSLRAPFR